MYYSSKRATMQGMDVRGFVSMRRIVNIFGAIGYSLLIFAYAVSIGVLIMWIIQGGHLEVIGVSQDTSSVVQPDSQNSDNPSFIWQTLTYIFMICMFLVTLFILVTLPYWLGRGGSRVLKRIIRYCQYPVTLATLLTAKVLTSFLGAALVVVCGLLRIDTIVILTLLSITLLSLVIFLVQHYLAKTSEVVEPKDVW